VGFSFAPAAAGAPSAAPAFNFGGGGFPAAAPASAFTFGGGAPASGFAAAAAAAPEGEEEEADVAALAAKAKEKCSAVGALAEGERVLYTAEATLKVFKKAEKVVVDGKAEERPASWGDFGSGQFAIAVGGGPDGRGARVGFKVPLASRAALSAELCGSAKVEELPLRKPKAGEPPLPPGKQHGGIRLTLLVTVREKAVGGEGKADEPPKSVQQVAMYQLRTITQEAQEALLAALKKALAKQF
jgi:hypothetical protein